MTAQHVPVATYRLQLHREFSFDSARELTPYLRRLGVTHMYSSPILAARPGSMHGYDVVDPARVNPELGGEEKLERLCEALRSLEMGLVLDIVPNHMAIASENGAWMDVLAHGRASRYASWFDIAWSTSTRVQGAGPGALEEGGIALPVLGTSLDDAIEAGEITIAFEGGRFYARYLDKRFPLEPRSAAIIFERALQCVPVPAASRESGDRVASELSELLSAARSLPDWRQPTPQASERRRQAAAVLESRLQSAVQSNSKIGRCIDDGMRRSSVRELLEQQPYRLCHWQRAMRRLTYRRFFDITDLIGVRVEDPQVFRETHELTLRLVRERKVTGLRIDHIDGLADPAKYLHELKGALRSDGEAPCYVIVEKILAGEETLEESWPVSGTTGYDFLNALSGIFVDTSGLNVLAAYQDELVPGDTGMARLVYAQKKRMAKELFGGEVEALTSTMDALSHELLDAQLSHEEIEESIVEVSARLPVYRTYITREDVRLRSVRERDRRRIADCISAARDRSEERLGRALDCLERLLLVDVGPAEPKLVEALADFIVKWQQFTGPLAAKGVEDTALYRDARLVSLNTVGADPESIEHPGGVEAFHLHNLHCARHWPHTMTTTSTHDTKRSEDVQSRIHVLSEIANDWTAAADRWRSRNRMFTSIVDGAAAPDVINELFLYQTMLGAWPLDESDEEEFAERMVQYAVKAAREAKAHTNWIAPNEQYEAAVTGFVRSVLDRTDADSTCGEIRAMARRIAFPGALNALSRTLLKVAAPGVPDFYQGTELWDFSLVDPDNRRPVDFDLRRRLLEEIAGWPDEVADSSLSDVLHTWRDGRVKMLLTHRGLRARSEMKEVFLGGQYLPLQTEGDQAAHVCAFARRAGDQWAIAAAPMQTIALGGERAAPLGDVWTNTTIRLPDEAPTQWRDAMTGREVAARKHRLRVAGTLRLFPVALLTA